MYMANVALANGTRLRVASSTVRVVGYCTYGVLYPSQRSTTLPED